MQRCASKLFAVDGQRINTNAERASARRMVASTKHQRFERHLSM
jgi:hypothetical protein